MNIGSLYLVKKYYWFFFPTKEIAPAAAPSAATADIDDYAPASTYWRRLYNCEMTYFSPDSIIVFLEEDGKYKKVLTSDGKIGWTWFDESYNDSFEEMKA